jgi:hypothetical protein
MGDKEAVGALVVGLIVWLLGTLLTGTTFWPFDLMLWLACEVLVEQASSCQ